MIIDGFRKVAKPDHGGLTSIQDESVEFWHTNFRRDHPELLPLVQKRASEINQIFTMWLFFADPAWWGGGVEVGMWDFHFPTPPSVPPQAIILKIQLK